MNTIKESRIWISEILFTVKGKDLAIARIDNNLALRKPNSSGKVIVLSRKDQDNVEVGGTYVASGYLERKKTKDVLVVSEIYKLNEVKGKPVVKIITKRDENTGKMSYSLEAGFSVPFFIATTKISELKISKRAMNALIENNIKVLGQLQGKKRETLLSLKNVGEKIFSELESICQN